MNATPVDEPTPPPRPREAADLTALGLLAVALLLAVHWHLLLALIAGLSAFGLHRALLSQLARWCAPERARHASVVIVLLVLAAAIFAAVEGLADLSPAAASGGLPRILELMADAIERLRSSLPAWLAAMLPGTAADLHDLGARWLRGHTQDLRLWGHHTLRGMAHLLAGLVVGFLASVSLQDAGPARSPFLRAWRLHLGMLEEAFVDIAAAQLRIAVVNTALTALYLLVLAPMLGYRMPLAGALVAVTFVTSLLPVIGNLISNTAIFLTGLTVSPWLGVLSLAFLIGIHKLEYFLNAHIVGSRIGVRAYELLAVMLLMEAAFGLTGLIAAPIYYAWATREARLYGVI